MRTFVYVDGFNLYYRALKGTACKWLDLPALFAKILQSHHDILKVKYFTARVSGTPADPSKPQRQDIYLRALRRHRPEVEVYFGHFLSPGSERPSRNPWETSVPSRSFVQRRRARTSTSRSICSMTVGWTPTTARWWSATTATSRKRCVSCDSTMQSGSGS